MSRVKCRLNLNLSNENVTFKNITLREMTGRLPHRFAKSALGVLISGRAEGRTLTESARGESRARAHRATKAEEENKKHVSESRGEEKCERGSWRKERVE